MYFSFNKVLHLLLIQSLLIGMAHAKVYSEKELSRFYSKRSALDEVQVSKKQKGYFEDYMETEGNAYVRLNRYLREDRTPKEPKKDLIIDSMLKVFTDVGNKLPKDLTIFRGTAFDFLGDYPEKGDIISDKAFISTSISPEIARSFGLANYPLGETYQFSSLMMIYSEDESFNGLYIRHSQDSDESAEGEVLLKPDSRFVVVDFLDIKVKDPFDSSQKVNRRLYLTKYCQSEKTCLASERIPTGQMKIWAEFVSCTKEGRKCQFN